MDRAVLVTACWCLVAYGITLTVDAWWHTKAMRRRLSRLAWIWRRRIVPILMTDVGEVWDRFWCGLAGHYYLPSFEPGTIYLKCDVCGAKSPGWRWDVKIRPVRVLRFRINLLRLSK
jgi:hypothetical protein